MNYSFDIKNAVSMEDVCHRYGIDINRGGFIKCCFHDDRKPSVKVYPRNRGFCCFSCGVSGSVIDWTMQYFGLSFKDAALKLDTDFNLGLNVGGELTREQQRIAEREARKQREKQLQIKREGERLENAYHVALDEYIALGRVLTANKPQSEDDISPEYTMALLKMPIAKYNLEVADIALYNFEHRNDIP